VSDTGGPAGGWTIRFVPSGDDEERRREAFETMIDDALDQIPLPFRDHLDTVAIVAEDEPPAERVLPGQTLFGLFQGVPRTTWGADNAAIANKISIYRGPHERFYPDPAMRARAVEATVFHEVAHHFGISDDRLRELQHR
jgi:predicted Zn-dependent protease with MMP-like domain